MNILEIKNLSVLFETPRGDVEAVKNLSMSIQAGETLGIVGESGSGKSVSSLALMGLLAQNAKMSAEKMQFLQHDLLKLTESQKQNIRGSEIAMIFQDPMTSLNPCFTIGFQLMESIGVHQKHFSKQERLKKSIDLLDSVGISEPETRMKAYPYQLSGGMSQRVMIAMALACKPKLLIADEPTTALDVTIQAQILDLLTTRIRDENMALILITHDIGIVAQYTNRMLVMYAGQAVEEGETHSIIENPRHPYTKALLDSLPSSHSFSEHRTRLASIPGLVPDLIRRPSGCQMHPRCPYVQDHCRSEMPGMDQHVDRLVRCFYPLNEGTPPLFEDSPSESVKE